MKPHTKLLFAATLFPFFAFGAITHSENKMAPQAIEQSQPTNEITPSFGPLPNHTVDIAINAEFLWWYASMGDLPYAKEVEFISRNNSTDPTLPTETPSRRKIFDITWDPGLRLGLDLITNHDGWNLSTDWTYFYNSAHESLELPPIDANNIQIGTKAYLL